jgi:hypothetical protein
LAYGHVALSYPKPSACREARNAKKYDDIFVAKLSKSKKAVFLEIKENCL